jgi:hypothetical protein
MSAAIDEMNNTTSTLKHRAPLVMGVPLRIVSSHQGTQKKMRSKESIVIYLLCTLGKLSCKPTSTLGEHKLGELPHKSPTTLGEHTLGELPHKSPTPLGEHTLGELHGKPPSTLGEHTLGVS